MTTLGSVSLVSTTGGIHFNDGAGTRRYAERGIPFDVDEATAEILLRDAGVQYAGDHGPAVTGQASAPTTPFVASEDVAALKVAELRDRHDAVGLDSSGNKADLARSLTAYQAGFAAGAAAQAASGGFGGVPVQSIDPNAPAPNSSEAEPGPPPPEGGLTPENEQHNTGAPSEGTQTGAITLDDLGDGGKTK